MEPSPQQMPLQLVEQPQQPQDPQPHHGQEGAAGNGYIDATETPQESTTQQPKKVRECTIQGFKISPVVPPAIAVTYYMQHRVNGSRPLSSLISMLGR